MTGPHGQIIATSPTHAVHYIDESWTLHNHLLDTAELSVEHMGVNLATDMEETL